MAKFSSKLSVLCVVLLISNVAHCSREDRKEEHRRDRPYQDLKPRQPQEIFRSEGGRIEKYDPEDYNALCEAEIGAMRITLEPQGLILPCYKDSNLLLAVTQGKMRAGLVNPFTDKVTERTVFELQRGDVLAIPKGFAAWMYNDGNEQAQFMDFADTTPSTECGCFKTFHLAGGATSGKVGGSVLQGFSKDIIAHAWDVDEQTAERVLGGQDGRVIIKVGERQRRSMPSVTNSGLYMDFVYRLGDAQPDIRVPHGGELRQLNSLKLPILKKLGISETCVKLQPGALKAPHWVHNSPHAVYVTKGSGRVQVVRENGQRAVDTKMEEGSLLIIPANYPTAKIAGDEGMEFGVFYKTDLPVESFLAGRNSVYKGMPRKVVSSALQIDEQLQQKLEERRTEDAYIFPSRRQSKRSGEGPLHFMEDFVRTFV